MLAKPKEPYSIVEEKGILRVAISKKTKFYYLAMVTSFFLFNLLTIGLYIVIAGPLSKSQWLAVTIVGVLGLAGYLGFLILFLPQKAYIFDRGTDRFLHGNKLVSRVAQIRHLEIHRESNEKTRKLFYVLSVVLEQGEPHVMYKLEEPATQLFLLAEKIAEYVGTKVCQGEDLLAVLKDLETRFGRWYRVGLFLFFVSASFSTLAWWGVLRLIGDWRAARFSDAAYALTPMALAWLLPAMFLGLISGYAIVSRVYRWLLKDRYQDYIRFEDLKHGYNTRAALFPTYLTVTIIMLAAVLLFLDWYVVFIPEEIVINRLFSVVEERHPYSQVHEIKTAPQLVMPNGKKVHRSVYLVRFSDGTYWSTDQDPSGLDERGKKNIAEYVSSKSHIPINQVEFLNVD